MKKISYGELAKMEAKARYGSKWGLKYGNALRRATALERIGGSKFLPEESKTKDVKGYITFGILANKPMFEYLPKTAFLNKANVEKEIAIARLSNFMKENTQNEILPPEKEGDENRVLLSPNVAFEKYKRDEITKEELNEAIKYFKKNSKAYQYKAY